MRNEKLPAKIRNRQTFSLPPIPFNIILEVLANAIRNEKEFKRYAD